MIVVIDSCGANFASIINAFRRLNLEVRLSSNPQIICRAKFVILPGVGNAKHAMEKLHQQNLTKVLPKLTQPVLGICLGMQLLYEKSLEGNVECLGIISGVVDKLSQEIIIPHMGWNQFQITQQNELFTNLSAQKNHVYFVHSYKATVNNFSIAETYYGEQFCSIVKKNNFYGMQFHPEKSGAIGSQLLKNFVSLS